MLVSEGADSEILITVLPVDQGLVGLGSLNVEGFILVLADFKGKYSDDRILGVVATRNHKGLSRIGRVGLNRDWAEIGCCRNSKSGTIDCHRFSASEVRVIPSGDSDNSSANCPESVKGFDSLVVSCVFGSHESRDGCLLG